ncbi:MAG: iron-sulfur cluster carrier protein ApbC [Gammaproteobacteria bacterium]|nr:MAG: iron-sulfur cluster carrier protein ApbC [Gammaproteobacteria bacterium]RLA50883.1 MAG: iron-sulfur cluster carrier protein ApbC [Gammaproteobacteria bacterium]
MVEAVIESGLGGVKYIVAVASGKGGVGKSTTAVNLALALQAQDLKVGILDADIYGPSLPKMLGIADTVQPQVVNGNAFVPVPAHGLKSMSIGYLTTEATPMVWRGPMAGGALVQMMEQSLWGELDVLVVDMPPGTGDIQLTLAQKARVSGAVVVTTPQDIALLDARKGIEMFRKVDIPVLGIVENMALHVCSNCGHTESVFGEGGGQKVASEYQTRLLGSLPLDKRIREEGDRGTPIVLVDPDGEIARCYRDIASSLITALAENPVKAPVISIED